MVVMMVTTDVRVLLVISSNYTSVCYIIVSEVLEV